MFAFQRPLLSPFKYPLQAVKTWYILWRQRPRAVIVQNPPLPAVLCVAIYSRLHRARFVIDSHSAALVDKKWAWSRPAQRWLGRHAAATLIHTVTLRDRVKGAGRVMVQESPPLARSGGILDIPQRVMPEVVVISSFAGDEPVAETLAAAASMPDVQFVFTGNPERAGNPQLLRALPPNVRLFGWQSYDSYIALLRSTNVALCLTTRNLTLLRGAWEAVYVGQPLVTTGWPVQRDCFVRGTIFVDNNAASIAVGVREALRNEASLRAEMRCLAEEKRSAWNTALQMLCDVLALPAAAVVDG